MNTEIVESPCISVCKTDTITGYCYGCGRTNEDKTFWKEPNTTNEWKENNLELIRSRMQGWQLNAFDASYQNKKNNGISLIKQKLLESKV